MVELWIHSERPFGLGLVITIGIEHDNTPDWKVELVMGEGWFKIRAFGEEDSNGGSEYRQYMIIDNTDNEDSSASSNPILQMGDLYTSDYNQEIPHDDSVHGESGASGSQIFPVEDHSGADDYHGNPQCPVPGDTPETHLAAASISDEQEYPLNPFPAGAHPSSSESWKEQFDNGDGGEDHKNDEYYDDDDMESWKEQFDNGVDVGEEHENNEDEDGHHAHIPNRIAILQSLINFKAEYSVSPMNYLGGMWLFVEEYLHTEASVMEIWEEIGLMKQDFQNGNINDPTELRLCQWFWRDEDEKVDDGPPALVQPFVVENYPLAHLINPGKNASDSSSNIPASELSGEAAGMNIDNARGKKTGSNGDNPVMAAGNAMLEGSSSGKANVLNTGDVAGCSVEAAERKTPEGASSKVDETKSSDHSS